MTMIVWVRRSASLESRRTDGQSWRSRCFSSVWDQAAHLAVAGRNAENGGRSARRRRSGVAPATPVDDADGQQLLWFDLRELDPFAPARGVPDQQAAQHFGIPAKRVEAILGQEFGCLRHG
jgi:hypothetical protein